ncbi:Oidioi.mRNA.OKI2018_I69.chr1.g1286.t1.cds [Oikopleura dioica]|uniref:Oidioi.mRNA.OKI2018_I69.chr1.g1286.t1.cds n=1 Tax=Oikopleura dioica TaxID=34765 RepID=A0ABN7SR87_OIKDI|nr:Oidioi.mRNA.OKI2018_I69.chr1.g1286.t1.cds [Oikopleura dioica]
MRLSLARRFFTREVPKETFKSSPNFKSSSPLSSFANQLNKAPSYSGQKADSPVASAGAAILCAVACVIYLNQDLVK